MLNIYNVDWKWKILSIAKGAIGASKLVHVFQRIREAKEQCCMGSIILIGHCSC